MHPLGKILGMIAVVLLAGCAAQETHHAIAPQKVESFGTAYSGPKSKIVVGQFDNTSTFMRGIFSDGVDRLGQQAKDILITHLQQTGRFSVMDRKNLAQTGKEAGYAGKTQKIKGASYVLSGEVAEFGRKETGDIQAFGLLGAGKQQVAYAKINLKIVDVETSEIVFSTQGEGEYQLNNREVLGFGSTAGYDSTLNGKVLDLAIREAVNRLVEGLERGQWRPEQ
jgi:curli biogenesis system outer membrane secretion channel CsgG